MKKSAISVLLIALVVLLAGGCGGGSDSIDKVSFIEQAEAICKRTSTKIAASALVAGKREYAKPDTNPKTVQITLVEKVLAPGLASELKGLRGLGVPSESKQEIQAFLQAMEKLVDKAETNPRGLSVGRSSFEPVALSARRFGLSNCPVAVVAQLNSGS